MEAVRSWPRMLLLNVTNSNLDKDIMYKKIYCKNIYPQLHQQVNRYGSQFMNKNLLENEA